MMWTNKAIRNDTSGLFVEFTSPDNNKFTKKYNNVLKIENVEEFIANKLNDIEILSNTSITMQNIKNEENAICDLWTFKLTSINMPYDYIEITAEINNPKQTFYKMFQITEARTTEYVSSWMTNEISKVREWVLNNDIVSLSDYFGAEVIEWLQ